MNWNKLVTETLGEVEERDYEGSMDACRELWEEVGPYGLYDLVYEEDPDHRGPIQGPKLWVASWLPEDEDPVRDYKYGGYQETPQLAIIKAYLKSKGVTTDIAECEACPASRGCEEYIGSDYCNERRIRND